MQSLYSSLLSSQHYKIPPVSGFTMWLDGSDPAGNGIIPANGATVATWNDKSGNGNNMSGGVSPIYASSGINSLSAISFTGSQYYRAAMNTPLMTQTALTFFVAELNTLTVTGTASVEGIASGANNDNNNTTMMVGGLQLGGGNIECYRFGSLSTATLPANGNGYVFAGLFDGTNNTVYMNGTASSPVASSGTMNFQTCNIGTRWLGGTPAFQYKGYMGEVILYPTNLSSTQMTIVNNYLMTKWRI